MKIALVCIAKNEDYYLEEWMDYNHKLGFDNIFIYMNDWSTDIERPYLVKYNCPGDIKQLIAYNHFIHFYKSNFDYVAFLDCDEFITLVKHNNIKEFLYEYHNPNGICLNWYLFGSNNKLKRENNSLLKQFQYRNSEIDKHIKVIMNLKSDFNMILPHNANISVKDTNGNNVWGPFNFNGPSDIAYINHYRNKTYEDYELRCERGRADCNLVAKISEWEENKLNNIEIKDTLALDFLYNKK
jgi:hypothetical protein